jgi:hypothetical protein
MLQAQKREDLRSSEGEEVAKGSDTLLGCMCHGVEELFPVRGSDLLQTLALSSSAQPLVMAAIANAKQGSPRPYIY